MSSQIDPEPVTTPPAAVPPRPTPAPANQASSRQFPPRPAAAEQSTAQPADSRDDDYTPSLAAAAVKQAPAWAISMLVHVVALLSLALVVNEPPKKEVTRIITSSGPQVEDEFTEFEDEIPEQPPLDVVAPAADVAVATEVAVAPVQVMANADELDAAPLAVEFTDFGTETAPASDMMASVGAVGGMAGGLGGRAQAAKLAVASGGGADTEQAVDRSLKWIAIHQLPDGGWSFDMTDCPSCGGKCSGSGRSRAKDRDRRHRDGAAALPRSRVHASRGAVQADDREGHRLPRPAGGGRQGQGLRQQRLPLFARPRRHRALGMLCDVARPSAGGPHAARSQLHHGRSGSRGGRLAIRAAATRRHVGGGLADHGAQERQHGLPAGESADGEEGDRLPQLRRVTGRSPDTATSTTRTPRRGEPQWACSAACISAGRKTTPRFWMAWPT